MHLRFSAVSNKQTCFSNSTGEKLQRKTFRLARTLNKREANNFSDIFAYIVQAALMNCYLMRLVDHRCIV